MLAYGESGRSEYHHGFYFVCRTAMLASIEQRLAGELAVSVHQVQAAIALMDEGATVPFIARYRKEATGGLDDVQLRQLQERLVYLRELEQRRAAIIESIENQGKMTPLLLEAISGAEDKSQLEDIYLPYRTKRRTKAKMAAEAGLDILANDLLENPELDPETEAAKYLRAAFSTEDGDNPGVADVKAALDGARQILIEKFSEEASLINALRTYLQEHGVIESKVTEGKEQEGIRFSDYFDYQETIKTIASHRLLALLRGRREEILNLKIRLDSEEQRPRWDDPFNACEARIAAAFNIQNRNRSADKWLLECVRWAWRVRLSTHLETELMTGLRENAEAEAISVFARNLKALLLAAPAGPKVTLGLDPGIRTGVKVAVVDRTGKVLDTATIYPHQPRNDWEGSLKTLYSLVQKYGIELIAIGNGTASRETDRLAGDLLKMVNGRKIDKIVVSEAGASVYSASEYASHELPDMDVSLRGAVSIARRLQDPLAELVKIDPKSIGVGQYQHDVAQTKLARSLDATVEDCVNAVGVDVNTASVPLLTRVSGLTETVAENIVQFRNKHGRFASRADLRAIPRLGDKTFELAAGFLRIPDGDNPLDASAVHPESYELVEKILQDSRTDIKNVIGNESLLKTVKPEKYVSDRFGIPTIVDILKELEKPGRDPRPEFVSAHFREGVEDIKDLRPDMILEGVVTNVTAFGAFVDIGVHQDGLVHISALSDKFVKDPHQVVSTGQVVRVKVVEVDLQRRRIALTMNLAEKVERLPQTGAGRSSGTAARKRERPDNQNGNNAMAEAFAKLGKRI